MDKIKCPKCGSNARFTYAIYIHSSMFKDRFYRCTSNACLFEWNRSKELRKKREARKKEELNHYMVYIPHIIYTL